MNKENITKLIAINAKLEALNTLMEPPLTNLIEDIQEDIQEIINNEEIEDVLNDDNLKIHIEEPRIIDKDRAKEVKEEMDRILKDMGCTYELYNDNIIDSMTIKTESNYLKDLFKDYR